MFTSDGHYCQFTDTIQKFLNPNRCIMAADQEEVDIFFIRGSSHPFILTLRAVLGLIKDKNSRIKKSAKKEKSFRQKNCSNRQKVFVVRILKKTSKLC